MPPLRGPRWLRDVRCTDEGSLPRLRGRELVLLALKASLPCLPNGLQVLQSTYDATDPQSGPTVVTHDLEGLGIGQHWTRVGGQAGLPIFDRRIPPGHGWCRALHVAEAHWPDSAELCAQVDWHPDLTIRNEGSKAEYEEHWRTRVSAVSDALESLGYVVQMPGPRPTPMHDTRASLLVYRLRDRAQPADWPKDAWDHLEGRYPQRPHWPERSDEDELRRALRDAGLMDWSERTGYFVGSVDRFFWPPYSSACCFVGWRAPEHATERDQIRALSQLKRFLTDAGYTLKSRTGPWRSTDWQGVYAYLPIETPKVPPHP